MFSKRSFLIKLKFILFILILVTAILPSKSIAVTNPDTTSIPAKDVPFLVSLWTYNPDTFEREEQFCSGVLLNNYAFITAAHCVQNNPNFILVTSQSSAYERGEVLSVYRFIVHPRYDAQTSQNDIAVGVLNFPPRTYFDLLTPTIDFASKKIKSKKLPDIVNSKTRLFGWGVNQNGNQITNVNSVLQNDYSASASKYFKNFNNNTMLAAGYYDKIEKQFAGPCYGDSGGPLIANYSPSELQKLLQNSPSTQMRVAGIVSYGSAQGCATNAPAVYSKLSYYANFILESTKNLLDQFKAENTFFVPSSNFSQPVDSEQILEQKNGPYGNYTSAAVQSGGGVGSADIQSIMFQTYKEQNGSYPYGINFYLTSSMEPCIEKQKGYWKVQISLSKMQKIDFEFLLNGSSGCYEDGKLFFNLTTNLRTPPAAGLCTAPAVKAWKTPSASNLDVVSFYFGKNCLGTSDKIWIRVLHRLPGSGDLEPGADMWAGPMSTKLP